MSKSKSKKEKKKEANLLPTIQKYLNQNMIEDLNEKYVVENQEVDRLKSELMSLGLDQRAKGVEYIRETAAIEKALGDKIKENICLTTELTQLQKNQTDLEYNLRTHYEKQYEKLKEEKNQIIDKFNNEISELRMELEDKNLIIEDMQKQAKELTEEIDKLSRDNQLTVDLYEKRLIEINDSNHSKLKATIDIFEAFLKNNPELITTDLFTVYHQLKSKYDIKINECLLYRENFEKIKDENRKYKLDISNTEDIINGCAMKQLQNKKKEKELIEEVDKKNRQIELMKGDYLKRYNELNEKFNAYISENDTEMRLLKKTIAVKNKEIEELKYNAEFILKQRSDIELFFIDAFKETKKEIIEKKKRDKEKKLGKYSSFLNRKSSADDGLYLTSARPVEIRDLDPENKEKILRSMFNKLHGSKMIRNFSNLRKLLY